MFKRLHSIGYSGLVLALNTLPIAAAQAEDAAAHRLLFPAADTRLPESDQRAIVAALGLAPAAEGAGLVFKDLECPAFQFEEVTIADLNGDGQAEVILRGGNICTSGGDGSSLWLLTRAAPGEWRMHLGFPAGGYTLLAETHQGYPAIQTGGMGWCEAVWRWDGQTYQHWKNVPTQPGGCDHLR